MWRCGGGGGAHTLPQLMCASQKTTYRHWFFLSTYRLQKRNSNCEAFIAIAFLVEPSGLPAALFKTHAHIDDSGALMKGFLKETASGLTWVVHPVLETPGPASERTEA